MIESLQDLENQLREKGGKLFLFKGRPEEVVRRCIHQLNIEALIVNRDYTPYSKQRDQALEKLCKGCGIAFYSFDDALLHAPEDTLKKDGKPYTIFTPYFRNALKLEISSPVKNEAANYYQGTIPFGESKQLFSALFSKLMSDHSLFPGGRQAALKILKKLGSYENYEQQRDYPAEGYSTHLSPYLKFTVCSPREVYSAICTHLNKHHELIRSLYWRDFFTSIAFFFPHVFGGCFHKKFDKIKWSNDEKAFQRWCRGLTGFPIVDAGMRELNETGFIHNRVRMIAASFLIKDLHIDWRWGERYFATTLVDYDPAVNNGNWQWSASTGCDAQPYFRIFNPWNQQKKFDEACIYIKKWVPELRSLSPKIIQAWNEERSQCQCPNYPAPMVDHCEAVGDALRAYESIRGSNSFS